MIASLKDTAIRLGLDTYLRPIVNQLRGRVPDPDDVESMKIIAGLPKDAICIDVGCNKGKFLDPMRAAAPKGRFFAFEPIPYLHDLLRSKYSRDRRVQLFDLALSSKPGEAQFFVNETDFGLSGLNARSGRMDADTVRQISVRVETLDRILQEPRIDFIKIDVEGAELGVLQGAVGLLQRCQPVVLFEFGRGGADYYGVGAEAMFTFFAGLGYRLFTVADFTASRQSLELAAFRDCYERNTIYNFVAAAE